jgi:hypothetical protein
LSKKQIISYIVVLALTLLSFSSSHLVTAETNQVDLKIQQSDDTVSQAFTAVLNAERSGANITSLLALLNDANGALAKAENYYRSGSFDMAISEADNAVSIAQQVILQAENTQPSIVSSESTFWSMLGFAVVAILILVLALLLLWRIFKKRYIRNLSQAKPEVASQ